MANTAQNAPKFEIGKLSPEEAERLATSFRPVWELDDAPFAQANQANGLSSADVDALAAGAGIAPSVRNTLEQPVALPEPAAASSLSVDVDVEADAPTVAEARPQSRPRPYTPPRPPTLTIKKIRPVDSGAYSPVKKSNTGLIIGVVAVLALGGAILGVRAVMSGDKPTATTTPTTTTPTREETHIPPPPDTVAGQQPVAPTQTAPMATKPVVDTTPAPTHAVVTNVAAPVHTAATAPTHTGNHTTGSAPTHHTSIVRDNPF
jgi:hypothetical protein